MWVITTPPSTSLGGTKDTVPAMHGGGGGGGGGVCVCVLGGGELYQVESECEGSDSGLFQICLVQGSDK